MPNRKVVEFLVEQHLEEFGEDNLIARTWQWVMRGRSRCPISHMNYNQFDGDGSPSRSTLATEASPTSRRCTLDELNRAPAVVLAGRIGEGNAPARL
jgi:hypothetical protein